MEGWRENKMKNIKESNNMEGFPRKKVNSVECRKRDLVIRIADWMKDKEEPGFDVEVYVGGVYDWNESNGFCLSSGISKKQAKEMAISYAKEQIERLL